MAASHSIKKLLTTYLRRLTNLSGNNRSLFLPRLPVDQFIDIHTLSQLNKEKSFSIIEALIAGKKKVICAVLDSRFEIANEASKKLKRLQRLDNFLFEERGSRDLHIGWPFVKGKFLDGTCVRCPLLFFPVEVVIQNNQWVIKPKADAEITFNKAMLLAYSFYNEVTLNEALLEENFDSVDRDSTVFRTELYKLLQQAALEINFNPDNFRDELIAFEVYNKTAFENQFNTGELKLFPEAVLGIFPQASSYLVPDYQKLIENDQFSDLEDFFLKRTVQTQSNKDLNFIGLVKEEKVYPVFSMDVWQENALKAVKLGNSIVVQGPPGTGKSHLICNLISDALANRQRVLVVCQKRAALDVVYARLKEKNVTPFLGLVHDFKTDRKEIYDTIASQIERIDEYKQKNNSLDTIQLERKFYTVSRKIDQLTEELEEFRTALFDSSSSGVSVKELYLQCSFTKPYINLKQDFSLFRFDELDHFLARMKIYAHYAQFYLDEFYEWNNRKSFSQFNQHDFEVVKEYLFEIPVYLSDVEKDIKAKSQIEIGWEEIAALANHKIAADELLELLNSEKYYALFKAMVIESEEETNALWLSNIERLVVECYEHEGPEVSIETTSLGLFQEVLHKSMNARRSLIGLIRWELFSKDKTWVARTLVTNQLKNDKAGLVHLERKLDRRLNLEHNLSKIRTKPWLYAVPESYGLSDFVHWFQLQQRIIHAKNIFNSIRGISNYINPVNLTFQEFHIRLKHLFDSADKLIVKKTIWSTYFTENQVKLFYDASLANHFEKILRRDFSGLVEFDLQRELLSRHEMLIIERLFEKEKVWDFERLKSLFTNSLGLSWIEHIEAKYPILTMVSSGKILLLENELIDCIDEKLKISNEILLLRAREKVTDNLEFNRLNNRITYRDLLHQVTKKKKVWPLRKLIQQHTSEIFHLMPCWLTSPETVSAIFPMEEIFDLVIFDEASQCFVERGIPAMYRGKQVIIAGDDQQLRPSDLYQPRWQEEGEDNPDAEFDSLLDLSRRYLLQADLKHHYRSQSLALIEFSNQHFYKGRLKLLPDRMAANDLTPPIDYQRVEGVWHDQTNTIEALHVATLVISLLEKEPRQSIGVITFNAPQQNLIQDILEAKLTETARRGETVFIKNIENVQGDERDIIIFSIGYAPDKSGKFGMQFGSLNQQGGENRLNVAITRAKMRIIIVASILPEQLHTEGTLYEGPKLLKAYLAFALKLSSGMDFQFADELKEHSHHSLKKVVANWCHTNYPASIATKGQIPSADITIQKDKNFEGLLFTDDEPYRTALSVKERHAFLPTTIEKKNWRLGKLYSRNYWQDAHKFFNEVAKFITHS